MKKYIIKDNVGNKKIIYAKDLAHALKIADSSLNDSTYELYLGNNFSSDDWVQIRKEYNNIKDSTKDEANLPTTIQALVNDEEAAIKSYEVAIKNLEGKIDETSMQVLINIMKDERRHVENLYAILNGQVTEKNLADSRLRDGKHTNKFARILKGKGINFTFTSDGEIKLNNKDDFEKALALAEDYSFEFGGYDYDPKHFIIAMAE